ncbi:MAG: PilN domain-containing protein [Xanthomonadales bacterium]|nr:PilN domain-containing protein [Xanthomonadales bacterium]
MVRVFDELVRTITDGVRLTAIKQSGDQLTLEGFAQSNQAVSAYMSRLEQSKWLVSPELRIIQARGNDPFAPFEFALMVKLGNPGGGGRAATRRQRPRRGPRLRRERRHEASGHPQPRLPEPRWLAAPGEDRPRGDPRRGGDRRRLVLLHHPAAGGARGGAGRGDSAQGGVRAQAAQGGQLRGLPRAARPA